MILRHRLKAIAVIKNYGKLPGVECYPGQLNQVFMNILANAIDGLEEANQGLSYQQIQAQPNQIIIQTELLAEQQKALIRIKDNDRGMSEELCSRIFAHFTTKPVGEGAGLGLSISYQIVVEKHGGFLKCISAPGQGAQFWIEIPISFHLHTKPQF